MNNEMSKGAVLETAKKTVGSNYSGITVTDVKFIKVPKGNVVKDGLLITTDAKKSAVIYEWEKFTDKLDIFNAIEKAVEEAPKSDLEDVLTNRSLWRIKAVNYERSSESGFLEDMAYVRVHDLAIVCVIKLCDEICYNISVTNEILSIIGVTAEEFVSEAVKNDVSVIKPFHQVLSEIMGEDAEYLLPSVDINEPELYVVQSDGGKTDYATGLFADQNKLESIRTKIGDFYILPSSIHELLIIPAEMVDDPNDLKGMICTVNDTVLSDEDYLSDHAYHYDGELKAA